MYYALCYASTVYAKGLFSLQELEMLPNAWN